MSLARFGDGREKCCFVGVIRAVGLKDDLNERQAKGRDLRLEELSANTVNAHAIVAPRHAREKRHDLDRRIRGQRRQGEGAVLPPAPAQEQLRAPRAHVPNGAPTRRYAAGNVSVNFAPPAAEGSTYKSPCMARARSRLIASPRPVPSCRLVSERPNCTNGSKIASVLSGGTPGP